MIALSLFCTPIFLALPAPIKAMVVVAGDFSFFSVEKQREVQEVRPVIEPLAKAE